MTNYSPWGCKQSDMTKHTYTEHTDKNYRGSAQILSKIDQKIKIQKRKKNVF